MVRTQLDFSPLSHSRFGVPFTIGDGGEVKNVGLSPHASSAQMVAFSESVCRAFSAVYYKRAQAMTDMVIESKKLTQRLIKYTKLRTAWAGYVARTGLYICNDLFTKDTPMFESSDEIGVMLDGYEKEKELRQKMVVGLTGNLDVDLKTNFVARRAARANTQDFFNLIAWLYTFAGLMMEHNLSYGFLGAAFLPRIETTEDGMSQFFDELVLVAQGSNEYMTRQRQECLLGIRNNIDSWIQAITMPASITTPDGKQTSGILPGCSTVCTDAEALSWAQYTVQFDRILGGRNRMPTSPDGCVMGLSSTEADRLRAGLQQTAIISAERQSIKNAIAEAADSAKGRAYTQKLERRLERAGNTQKGPQAVTSLDIPAGKVLVDRDEWEALHRKNGKMARSLAKAEKDAAFTQRRDDELEEARKEVERLTAKLAEQDAEIQSMAEAMLTQATPEPENESDVDNLDVSIFDGLNVLCVGGHPSFVQGLRQLHPNIRCMGTKRPADSAILHADVVWLQTTCMSHDNFIPVVGLCRQYGVPLRFFKCAGHIPCRFQMVEETRVMLDAGIIRPAGEEESQDG